ncbi:TlpA family protein disulfide reductase [Desulfosporosinus youngiae]|uniref:Peroxiredoxin n=1 Tax=Desulfosporosinus youngiae DSM 17734 TaxID=768710 RepID=H5XU60_9FIRM|nr:TlpA disulfide reductase family protein [Desulfosporosinus youngiae]EHQ89156.1 Peroxiredoxin [Desulfosporosinus youngiae DSM 17734]
MNKKTKTSIWTAAFVLFIVTAVLGYNLLSQKVAPQDNIDLTQNKGQAPQDSQEQEREKIKAPDFTVLDAEGNAVKLSELFGKPIVLNFWASWCPPCKGEMPDFNKVYEEVGRDITFMMVDLVDGQRETKEKGAQYVKGQGFTFPVYFDTEQDAARKYGIGSIPTTIFIDKDGYIVTGAERAIDEKTLQKGIDLIK